MARAAAQAQPVGAAPDLRALPASLEHRRRAADVPVGRVPVDHAHLRVGLHDGGRARQGAGDEEVVGGDAARRSRRRPTRGPRSPSPMRPRFSLVAAVLHARVGGGQARRDRGRVVGRAVVEDEHADVDALLLEDAAHAALEHVRVAVARDDDADAAALTPASPGRSAPPRSRRTIRSNSRAGVVPGRARHAAPARGLDALGRAVLDERVERVGQLERRRRRVARRGRCRARCGCARRR